MFGFEGFKRINLVHFIIPIIIILLITLYLIGSYQKSFDEAIFNSDEVYEHIRELSSAKYNGRLAGSKGNKLALQYIEGYFKKLGVEPAGENDTYYQHFETKISQFDSDPYFTIENQSGEIIEEFEIFKDYKFFTYWYGGGGSFEGDILFVDKYLYDIPTQLLKDKLIVMGGFDIRIKDVEHILENGSRGILFRRTSPYDIQDKDLQLQKKFNTL